MSKWMKKIINLDICVCLYICLYRMCILEKAMAPHSSTLAWKTPWTEEPGGLQFMGSHRVRHDWSDLAAAECTYTYTGASQVAQWWRIHLPTQETQEMQFWSLSQEDPLQEKMATHSSTPAWKNPMKRKAWQATVHGLAKELDTTEHTENLNLSTHREHLSPTPTHWTVV